MKKIYSKKKKEEEEINSYWCWLGDVDVDLGAVPAVVESLAQSGPLQHDRRDQEIERDGAVTVLLQEGHQEAETDKHHHVYILEHFMYSKEKLN